MPGKCKSGKHPTNQTHRNCCCRSHPKSIEAQRSRLNETLVAFPWLSHPSILAYLFEFRLTGTEFWVLKSRTDILAIHCLVDYTVVICLSMHVLGRMVWAVVRLPPDPSTAAKNCVPYPCRCSSAATESPRQNAQQWPVGEGGGAAGCDWSVGQFSISDR